MVHDSMKDSCVIGDRYVAFGQGGYNWGMAAGASRASLGKDCKRLLSTYVLTYSTLSYTIELTNTDQG